MLRMLGIFGLGGLFLLISPPLRDSLMGQIDAVGGFLNTHSPLSYIGVAVLALGGAMLWVYRAAQPRC